MRRPKKPSVTTNGSEAAGTLPTATSPTAQSEPKNGTGSQELSAATATPDAVTSSAPTNAKQEPENQVAPTSAKQEPENQVVHTAPSVAVNKHGTNHSTLAESTSPTKPAGHEVPAALEAPAEQAATDAAAEQPQRLRLRSIIRRVKAGGTSQSTSQTVDAAADASTKAASAPVSSVEPEAEEAHPVPTMEGELVDASEPSLADEITVEEAEVSSIVDQQGPTATTAAAAESREASSQPSEADEEAARLAAYRRLGLVSDDGQGTASSAKPVPDSRSRIYQALNPQRLYQGQEAQGSTMVSQAVCTRFVPRSLIKITWPFPCLK